MAALADSVLLRDFTLAGLPMPITVQLPEPLSDDDLIAFSHANRPYRIERNEFGELEIMSPLGFDGGQREIFAGARLFNWAEENGGTCASCDAGFQLPTGAVRSPDASWTSDERLREVTWEQRHRFPPVTPDFVIEILSESDSRAKLEAKMEMWISNGARLAWMIDPFAAEVWVYRPDEAVKVLTRPEWVEADSVVKGFRLETARMWAE